jgi:hypothetical protein
MQKQSYKIAEKTNSRKIAEFLSNDGQLLLPFLDRISIRATGLARGTATAFF